LLWSQEFRSGRKLCRENRIRFVQEAFSTNTSAEVTPVTELGEILLVKEFPDL